MFVLFCTSFFIQLVLLNKTHLLNPLCSRGYVQYHALFFFIVLFTNGMLQPRQRLPPQTETTRCELHYLTPEYRGSGFVLLHLFATC